MKKPTLETAVGLFVIAGLLCIGYLTIKLGKMELIGDNYYTLQARFQSVSGLTLGGRVEIAGVQVGTVDAIRLDPDRQIAVLSMKIEKDVVLTDDVIASIKTSGLIGDKYVKLSPGGSDLLLEDGDFITETESPIDIEELVGKYIFGGVK